MYSAPSQPSQTYGSGAPSMQTASAPIATKDQIGQLMMQVAPNGLGIVLGVGRGDFALRLLRDWRTSPGLYLCDPYIHIWKGYDDPNHSYDAVTRDLEAWWPLLPTGGLLAGSTFINDPSRNIGVRQAVEDFMRPRGVQILETTEPLPSWMVVKQ